MYLHTIAWNIDRVDDFEVSVIIYFCRIECDCGYESRKVFELKYFRV